MSTHTARFHIGQVVRHLRFDYVGVVFDIDPVFSGSEEWYRAVARSRPPKDRPWYHVLVDGADHTTYVAERHLEAAAPPRRKWKRPLLVKADIEKRVGSEFFNSLSHIRKLTDGATIMRLVFSGTAAFLPICQMDQSQRQLQDASELHTGRFRVTLNHLGVVHIGNPG